MAATQVTSLPGVEVPPSFSLAVRIRGILEELICINLSMETDVERRAAAVGSALLQSRPQTAVIAVLPVLIHSSGALTAFDWVQGLCFVT